MSRTPPGTQGREGALQGLLSSPRLPRQTLGHRGCVAAREGSRLRGSLCRWSCPRLTLPPNSRVRRGESRARGAVRGRNYCSETETGGLSRQRGPEKALGQGSPSVNSLCPTLQPVPNAWVPQAAGGAPHPAHVWLLLTEAAPPLPPPPPAPRKWIPGPQHHQVKAPDCGRQVTPRGTRVAER